MVLKVAVAYPFPYTPMWTIYVLGTSRPVNAVVAFPSPGISPKLRVQTRSPQYERDSYQLLEPCQKEAPKHFSG